MGQVPENKSSFSLPVKSDLPSQPSLIIGSGRLARHLTHYASLQNLSVLTWSRAESTEELQQKLRASGRILLAISDDALAGFVQEQLSDDRLRITHFSGAQTLPGVAWAHPLMSFGKELYELEFYKKIHFCLSPGKTLNELLPGWTNSSSPCSDEQKALYHALCVLGGNLPVLLWSRMEKGLVEMGIPSEKIRLYLERVSTNYLEAGEKALTGPLARRDRGTIQKNIQALGTDPFARIYQAFAEEVLK